jgi:predicted nicotinamide N-methyase
MPVSTGAAEVHVANAELAVAIDAHKDAVFAMEQMQKAKEAISGVTEAASKVYDDGEPMMIAITSASSGVEKAMHIYSGVEWVRRSRVRHLTAEADAAVEAAVAAAKAANMVVRKTNIVFFEAVASGSPVETCAPEASTTRPPSLRMTPYLSSNGTSGSSLPK